MTSASKQEGKKGVLQKYVIEIAVKFDYQTPPFVVLRKGPDEEGWTLWTARHVMLITYFQYQAIY